MLTSIDLQKLEEGTPLYQWQEDTIREIFELPFPRLIHLAQTIASCHFATDQVQLCTLHSVKTGGCKEDCAYCPQSAHHQTNLEGQGFADLEDILKAAKAAKESGSTRFCMGAAWRSPPTKGESFEKILEAVRSVSEMGLEVCTTLGMLTFEQAKALREAGVHAYNHNLDTSRDYYEKIISTRTYDERLETLKQVRKAGMSVCCGGIVGMGESRDDRIRLLRELACLQPHPESVPINLLVRVAGTPLEEEKPLDIFELVRTIATARILMPMSRIRLSAGREAMSDEAQALCFLAGANSLFTGEKLLTTKNPGFDHDLNLLERLGMTPTAQPEKPMALASRSAQEAIH